MISLVAQGGGRTVLDLEWIGSEKEKIKRGRQEEERRRKRASNSRGEEKSELRRDQGDAATTKLAEYTLPNRTSRGWLLRTTDDV